MDLLARVSSNWKRLLQEGRHPALSCFSPSFLSQLQVTINWWVIIGERGKGRNENVDLFFSKPRQKDILGISVLKYAVGAQDFHLPEYQKQVSKYQAFLVHFDSC